MNVMRSSYKINNEEAQAKINQIIFDHHLRETDISKALCITPQCLNYQLHLASNLDRDIEKGIYTYLRSKGIIQYTQSECLMITETFLEYTSLINQQISILSNNVKKIIANENVTDADRAKLLLLTKNLRAESDKELDELDSAIRGLSCGEHNG